MCIVLTVLSWLLMLQTTLFDVSPTDSRFDKTLSPQINNQQVPADETDLC